MNSARIFLFGGLIAFAILLMSLFYVDEREAAIKFRFGEIIESNYEPGDRKSVV